MPPSEQKARQFLEKEKAFHLGCLPTEQPHPKTTSLSWTLQNNTLDGIALLQEVDADLVRPAAEIFERPQCAKLRDAIGRMMREKRRVLFSGCGATGRLSIQLEAAWRRFWNTLPNCFPGMRREAARLEASAWSIMTGGDRALVRSVENYEDFMEFGREQMREAGPCPGDVVVCITEGGETSSVIGTAWQALEAGAEVFFVFNNPMPVLMEKVQRSREILEDDRITAMDLSTGPMAIAGSTRMQATTMELLIVGGCIETAIADFLRERMAQPPYAPLELADQATRFAAMIHAMQRRENRGALAEWTEWEAGLYARQGRLTCFATDFLIDVFTDTTERSPTFMLPPFRPAQDRESPVSWVFLKNPLLTTREAWRDVFQREPRGLDWDADLYQRLGAPETIVQNPPPLHKEQIYRFEIGREDAPSRYAAPSSAALLLGMPGGQPLTREALPGWARRFDTIRHFHLSFENVPIPKADFLLQLPLPESPLRLMTSLALKLALNTVSTATMARLGRVIGNWMACVDSSNKKLIDRSIRLVSQIAGVDYATACLETHTTLDALSRLPASAERPSPAALTAYRLRRKQEGHPLPAAPLPGMAEIVAYFSTAKP